MKRSAGILLYRINDDEAIEFFLVHPGGPFFTKKDEGVWTIPKGEFDPGEEPLAAAQREFYEETGIQLQGNFLPLGDIRQKAGKIVQAWALQGTLQEDQIKSNHFEIEWPPKSGKRKSYPEIDKAGWFTLEQATRKINAAQAELLLRLINSLQRPGP
jgi:predicted NUDIX family NTP pyrophosphohydrolase